MANPPSGPLHPRWGPFVRNAQALDTFVWLVEGVEGTQGKGKMWRSRLVTVSIKGTFVEFGVVKPALNQRRKGQWRALLWHRHPGQDDNQVIEAFFPTEELAVKFLIHNAKFILEN